MMVLRGLWRWVARQTPSAVRQYSNFGLVIVCMLAHCIEITIFAIGFGIMAPLDSISWDALRWRDDGHLEVWYYSASFYTSLGSTNPPSPGLRLLAGLEALTGLILITWTASFLYLVMSRTWEGHTK